MPELELCPLCGKQVLTSRHSWNKDRILCRSCFDLEKFKSPSTKPYKLLTESAFQDFPTKSDLLLSRTQRYYQNNSDKDHQEILVTWSSLGKIFTGLILLVLLILTGYVTLRNGSEKTPYEEASSSKIN
ncbi:hypothetical protein [Prochlorococcus sp. MIT 1307]|uniref:hypothetical protein n=1 Tax=Prochlorococcus sp. MIT 1307 TaxID=3096219 RepID=UPI002A74A7C9|nr:hypothetical protein [Prochlorococcus sp. MIT 1307]